MIFNVFISESILKCFYIGKYFAESIL